MRVEDTMPSTRTSMSNSSRSSCAIGTQDLDLSAREVLRAALGQGKAAGFPWHPKHQGFNKAQAAMPGLASHMLRATDAVSSAGLTLIMHHKTQGRHSQGATENSHRVLLLGRPFVMPLVQRRVQPERTNRA